MRHELRLGGPQFVVVGAVLNGRFCLIVSDEVDEAALEAVWRDPPRSLELTDHGELDHIALSGRLQKAFFVWGDSPRDALARLLELPDSPLGLAEPAALPPA